MAPFKSFVKDLTAELAVGQAMMTDLVGLASASTAAAVAAQKVASGPKKWSNSVNPVKIWGGLREAILVALSGGNITGGRDADISRLLKLAGELQARVHKDSDELASVRQHAQQTEAALYQAEVDLERAKGNAKQAVEALKREKEEEQHQANDKFEVLNRLINESAKARTDVAAQLAEEKKRWAASEAFTGELKMEIMELRALRDHELGPVIPVSFGIKYEGLLRHLAYDYELAMEDSRMQLDIPSPGPTTDLWWALAAIAGMLESEDQLSKRIRDMELPPRPEAEAEAAEESGFEADEDGAAGGQN